MFLTTTSSGTKSPLSISAFASKPKAVPASISPLKISPVDKPILVPENYNLIILAGADLKFSEDSNILIYNGSLKILGEKNIFF